VNGETPLYDSAGNRKYLNTTERLELYQNFQLLTDLGRRSFCLTLFYTGCRISEALNMTPASIDFADKMIVLRTLKQQGKVRYRALPVPDHLLDMLEQQISNISNDDLVWDFSRSTGWRIVKKCMSEIGLDGIKASPKGLRHGFAIACVTEGIPITTVQRWLGHTQLDTTSVYLDFVGEDERELAKKIWPTDV